MGNCESKAKTLNDKNSLKITNLSSDKHINIFFYDEIVCLKNY